VQAVTFQGVGSVRVEDVPEPQLRAPADAVVAIKASGICGSDLHIYHGRHPVEEGFTIGHEFVGRVVAGGDDVTAVGEGDRVIGCFVTACGRCFFCRRRAFHKCTDAKIFGHGEISGGLQGAQAEQVLVPHANITLRRAPEAVSDEAALFAGDVLGTGFHAVRSAQVGLGDTVAVLGLGPVGLCAVQVARAAGAARVLAIDSVAERLEMARAFGAQPVHLTEEDPRAAVKAATEGRGVDACIEAVGHPDALDMAIRSTRNDGRLCVIGVYGKRAEVHMGLVWNKALHITAGPANVVGHVDEVLALIEAGVVDPTPLVTHRMQLSDAPEGYAIYDRREALKIVLRP
jgi:2-desacetyl-2-hydroxyethyl bacteriochlorophyllide A dehydrogenase